MTPLEPLATEAHSWLSMTPNPPLLPHALALAALIFADPERESQRELTHRGAPTPTPLDEALAAAQAAGKPLLVLIVAPTLDQRRCQARWFDDLLEVGDANLLEDLALVEVACATREQVEARLAHTIQLQTNDELGLLELIAGSWTWIPIHLSVSPWCGAEVTSASRLDLQMARTATELRGFVRGSDEQFARRVRFARGQLTRDELQACDTFVNRRDWPPADVADRGAWILRAVVESDPNGTQFLRMSVRANVEQRLIDLPPFGARWVNGYDGSTEVEFLERDDAEERLALAALAAQERARGTALRSVPSKGLSCSAGPCGTGSTSRSSHEFLSHYVRYLVLVPDDR